MMRLERLSKKIGEAIKDILFTLENKPILTIIFGSYAKGNYTEESDLDILFVFSKFDKK
jgi:predicted nucleotidyltransferase